MSLRPSRSSLRALRPRSRAVALALYLGLAASGAVHAGVETQPLTQTRPQPFRLTSPQAGETWTTGTWATVEWEPAGEAAARAGLEEWEAFLSVDDGWTYSVRLTPHLDIDLHRFTFEVPRLPTREARLMLRFGDERVEHGFEVPGRFAIVLGPRQGTPFGELAVTRIHLGERARAGDPGTVLWIEGSRRGGAVRTEVALPLRNALSGADLRPWPFFLFFVGGPSSDRLGLAPLDARSEEVPPIRRAGVLPAGGPFRAAPPSVRLLIHRFNE